LILAAAIAIWGIITQRAIARRRAKFDHIARTEADKDHIEARKKFKELAKNIRRFRKMGIARMQAFR
jgi:hypothetical protein